MAALEVVKIDLKRMTAIPQETSQTRWFAIGAWQAWRKS